jgi:hypothetical protein
MDSYDTMNRVLITDDVDSQCVDMLVANGFSVEKDIKLAKQPQEQLIKRVQVLAFFSNQIFNKSHK